MASSGQQVMLTVAKQGAVYHGLAMLICDEPPQSLPGMAQCFLLLWFGALVLELCISSARLLSLMLL